MILSSFFAPATICAAGLLSFQSNSMKFMPGEVWNDKNGQFIQAHAGWIIQERGTYYWFGEDRTDGSHFSNVNVYSSRDLLHWEFRSHALPRQDSGELARNRVVERPKVLFNRSTRNYVMYVHIDSPNYREAKVGVAVSKSILGPYNYLGSFRPLDHQSRDMSLFQDTDGQAYLIFEDRESGVRIARLSKDYLKVESPVALIRHGYEAPAVIKVKGLYYLLGSFMTGWDLNPNQYATAKSLDGPWTEFQNVAPAETKTYQSQTAFILPVRVRHETKFIYVGDRWKPKNLIDSRYVWLPLQVSDGKMWIPSDAPWSLSDLGK